MVKRVFRNTSQKIATSILAALFAASLLAPLVLRYLDEQFRGFYVVLPFIFIVGILLSYFAYWKSERDQAGSVDEPRKDAVFDQSA